MYNVRVMNEWWVQGCSLQRSQKKCRGEWKINCNWFYEIKIGGPELWGLDPWLGARLAQVDVVGPINYFWSSSLNIITQFCGPRNTLARRGITR